MKTIIKLALFALLLFGCTFTYAQKSKFEVPKNYAFKSPEDFAKYDSTVIVCANWLQKLKMDQWQEKRKDAEKFLMAYVEGNPKLNFDLNPKIVTFQETNPHLVAIYVAGYAKFALTHPQDLTVEKCTVAGLKAVCKYYEYDPNLNKDKEVENFIHMNEKNQLRKWVKEQLKS